MGNKKAEPLASGAVVMTPKRRFAMSKIVMLATAFIVIAGIVGGAVWYSQREETERPQDAQAVVNSPKYQQARQETEKFRASGSYDAAKATWQEYIDGDYSEEEKYKAYLQIAALDESKNDCKAALVSYYAAEKLTDRTYRAENEAIARCSEKLGDWATAQAYYQKALDTFPGGQEYDSDRRFYQKKIDSMKQKAGATTNG